MRDPKIAIIGAGQIGSRHLQGMLQIERRLEFFVQDPSPDSLKRASLRAKEISHEQSLVFCNSINDLPDDIDIAIVATNSNIRAKVTIELLNSKQIKYLILEKVLFQKLEDYSQMQKLLDAKAVKCWVNHPLRLFPFYKDIKKKLKVSNNGLKTFELFGQNWGMGCNALHWIDIFTFLSDEELVSVQTDFLEPKIYPSKRDGFFEFSGTITGALSNGSSFSITSIVGSDVGVKKEMLSINSAFDRFLINKGTQTEVLHFAEQNNYELNHSIVKAPFQSEISGHVAYEILKHGNSELPTYKQASNTHTVFLRSMIKFYSQMTGDNQAFCPIT